MPITGKSGSIDIGGAVAEIVEWSIDHNVEAVETTNMDSSGNAEFIDGIESFSGTFTTLKILNKTGTQAAATFNTGATPSASEPKFTGKIVITNEPTATPVEGRQEFAYTFQGTAALTVATA